MDGGATPDGVIEMHAIPCTPGAEELRNSPSRGGVLKFCITESPTLGVTDALGAVCAVQVLMPKTIKSALRTDLHIS